MEQNPVTKGIFQLRLSNNEILCEENKDETVYEDQKTQIKK